MIRTDPLRVRDRGIEIVATCCAGMILVPALIGGVVTCLAMALDVSGMAPRLADDMVVIGLVLSASPIVSIFGLIPAIPLALLGLRTGYAGWLLAVICGAIAGIAICFILDDFRWSSEVVQIGTTAGAFWSALFWLSGKCAFSNVFVSSSRAE